MEAITDFIRTELTEAESVELHPLIDYDPNFGFTIGLVSKGNSENLIFLNGNVFKVESGKKNTFSSIPIQFSVRKFDWVLLQPKWKKELLLIFEELSKGTKTEFKPKSEVFESVIEKLKFYYWSPDERIYTLIACWIVGTYLHPLFSFYPCLNPQGMRETGKTTLLDILSNCCWNPTRRQSSVTEAQLFRVAEVARPTYIIDITKLTMKSPAGQAIADLLEVGTEKGGAVTRINMEKGGQPIVFLIYGAKVVATRYELPITPKTIRIICERAPSREYSKRRSRLPLDADWSKLVNCLLRASMEYWKEVEETYNTIEQTDKLVGRAFNYWAPILAICRVFCPGNYESLLGFAEEYSSNAEKGDWLSKVETAVITACMERVLEHPEMYQKGNKASMTVLLKDLTQEASEALPDKPSWQSVKSAVHNLGILKRSYNTSRGLQYQLDIEKVFAKSRELRVLTPEREQQYFRQCPYCSKVLHEDTQEIFKREDRLLCHLSCHIGESGEDENTIRKQYEEQKKQRLRWFVPFCQYCDNPIDESQQDTVLLLENNNQVHSSCLPVLGICAKCGKPVCVGHWRQILSERDREYGLRSREEFRAVQLEDGSYAHEKCLEDNPAGGRTTMSHW